MSKDKPHAKTYAVVAQKLDIAPEHCVVFEDAILGEQAAYRDQMQVVTVTTTLKSDAFQAPLLTIKDYNELNLGHLQVLFGQQTKVPTPDKVLAKRQYAQR